MKALREFFKKIKVKPFGDSKDGGCSFAKPDIPIEPKPPIPTPKPIRPHEDSK